MNAAAPTRLESRRRFRLIAALAAAVAAVQIVSWKQGLYDDAYITFRYARNLARGFGPVFNVGERVEGCTTFLQMVVLAGFARLGVDLRLAAAAVAFACLFAMAAAGAQFITRAETSAGDRTAWPWLFALLMVASPPVIFWARSGMETVWWTAAYFGALLAAAREIERRRWPIGSALLTVVAALLRPDGVALAAAIAAYWLFAAPQHRLRNAVVFVAVFGALYGVYFAWRYHYYGYWAPNTYYAKVGAGSFRLAFRGLIYAIWSALWMYFPPLAAWLGFKAARRGLPLADWEKLFLFAAGGQIALTIADGGDYLPYYRFLMPLLPVALLLTWGIDRRLSADVSPAGRFVTRLRLHLPPGEILGLFVAVNVALWLGGFNGIRASASRGMTRAWVEQAERLKPLIARDAVVAANAIGAAGYILDAPLIDVMGLTDATIAHLPIATGAGQAGHEKFWPEYVLSRAPDFILTCALESPRPLTACRGKPAETDPMRRAPQFLENYAFANHALPGGGFVATYVRRDRLGQPEYDGWFVSQEPPGSAAAAPSAHVIADFLLNEHNAP